VATNAKAAPKKKRTSSNVVRDARLTQRSRHVQRAKTKKRLWIVGAILLVAGLGFGAWTLLHTSLFSAKNLKVVGAVHESTAQVLAAGSLANHPPLISIDAGASEAGIDRLSWVKSSTVTLHWPSSVAVSVVERQPIAAIAAIQGTALADETGRVLEISKTPVPGPVSVAVPAGTKVTLGSTLPARTLGALHVAATLPVAFKGQVATVQANHDGTVSLQLNTPVSVILGPATELSAKYQVIASVIAGATLHPGDVLDVTVPQASTVTGP
jgi:cell division protein FtsQ